MSTPKFGNLKERKDSVPSLVDYFYHDTLAPHASNRSGLSPVPMESSNWRDEQRAWRETVLLFDQSHHMPESRSEEHTSELQSIMRISYAIICLKKNNHTTTEYTNR